MDTLEPFRIATIALAGGGRIGISRIPGRNDSYDGDLQAISDWGAHTVVSMTNRSEMVARGCEDLGLRLAARGIGWFHFPIRDFGGPTGGGLVEWPGLSAQLHEILDDRGAVLVHCHGGHGRAGMVALRLLVERGEAPEAALKRIRAVRPGAVQTDAQYRWAASAAE